MFSILGILAVILASIINLLSDDKWEGKLTFEHSSIDFGKLGQGVYWGLFPYMGWNALNAVTSEMKNPTRDLPGALLTSIYIVISISIANGINLLSLSKVRHSI